MLTRSAGLARYVWNWGLAGCKEHYEQVVKPALERGEKAKGLSRYDQINAWNAIKDELAPWARDHSARIPEYALEDLERAYGAWFASAKTPSRRRVGLPRFKARSRDRQAFRVRGAIDMKQGRVSLPRIGQLAIKGHKRTIDGVIRYAAISERAGNWFVSIMVKQEMVEPIVVSNESVGIDLGLTNSLTLSTGEVIQGPRAMACARQKLRRE